MASIPSWVSAGIVAALVVAPAFRTFRTRLLTRLLLTWFLT